MCNNKNSWLTWSSPEHSYHSINGKRNLWWRIVSGYKSSHCPTLLHCDYRPPNLHKLHSSCTELEIYVSRATNSFFLFRFQKTFLICRTAEHQSETSFTTCVLSHVVTNEMKMISLIQYMCNTVKTNRKGLNKSTWFCFNLLTRL